MKPWQSALFDLDGTLIDSVDLIVESYQYTARQNGLEVPTREKILAGMGTPLRVVLADLVGDTDLMEACLASYREFNALHHDEMVRVYPGVVEMMHSLHSDGIRLGLVTSKLHAGARRGLRLAGLEEIVEVVIGADDVVHPKPHGEPVVKALSLLGLPRETSCFVGDSHHDMHSGHAAGVATVGITWGPFDHAHLALTNPTHICATPEEFLLLVRQQRVST